jgi:hypothetical protein
VCPWAKRAVSGGQHLRQPGWKRREALQTEGRRGKRRTRGTRGFVTSRECSGVHSLTDERIRTNPQSNVPRRELGGSDGQRVNRRRGPATRPRNRPNFRLLKILFYKFGLTREWDFAMEDSSRSSPSPAILRNRYWILRHGRSVPNERGLIVSSMVRILHPSCWVCSFSNLPLQKSPISILSYN